MPALALSAALFLLVVAMVITGHARGAWLALHVPAEVATAALAVRQATDSVSALPKVRSGARPDLS
jgi:hypothetical protein